MAQAIIATYEKGVFKPSQKVDLKERQKVKITISPIEEDLSTDLLARVAEQGKGFDFLKDQREDIYSVTDGEQV
jgi:predicted DNA-binding antitoxin AbrB/MazE fold protein